MGSIFRKTLNIGLASYSIIPLRLVPKPGPVLKKRFDVRNGVATPHVHDDLPRGTVLSYSYMVSVHKGSYAKMLVT